MVPISDFLSASVCWDFAPSALWAADGSKSFFARSWVERPVQDGILLVLGEPFGIDLHMEGTDFDARHFLGAAGSARIVIACRRSLSLSTALSPSL
jgi:hypothetical protein